MTCRGARRRTATAARMVAWVIPAPVWAWLLLLTTSTVAAAATSPERGAGTPSVTVVLTAEPVRIDGRLDDAAWRRAGVVTRLTQVEPDDGAAPSEPTEVRLLYDGDFLYIGVRSYDSRPGRIVAQELEHDTEGIDSDDNVAIVLDTFLDRRNAYFFQVNALGARRDGLIENSQNPRTDWDGIWYADATRDRRGWIAEIAIPFKTVAFDAGDTAWGFNIERLIRRRNETIRWSATARDERLFDIGEAGRIEGFTGLREGVGLDIKASGLVRTSRDRIADRERTEIEPSLDLFYRFTPSLTAALTFNTDFAETEVDEREINLTRFDLFFPEKRDFFLQDAGIFEFGGLERNGRPFFSRRIGLDDDDQPVPIVAGAKITGRLNRLNLGLLAVRQEETDSVSARTLAVGRVTANVLEQSSLGMIATWGDPRSDDDNALLGVDFNFRSTGLLDEGVLLGGLWAQRSVTERSGSAEDDEDAEQVGDAHGARFGFIREPVELSLEYAALEREFRPALGFANRRGIRQYDAELNYEVFRRRGPVRGLLRSIDSGVTGSVVRDIDTDRLESGELELNLARFRNDFGDSARFSYSLQREVLEEEFEISDGVVIPPDDYRFDGYGVELRAERGRPVFGRLRVRWGEFFTGSRTTVEPEIGWRPVPQLSFLLAYQQNDVRLPQGDFTTRLARARANAFFGPDLSWSNLIQYDNVSERLSLFSRVRWLIEPGNEAFVVVTHGWLDEEDGLRSTTTEATLKVSWTLRF